MSQQSNRNLPRMHHYLPRFYLAGFTQPAKTKRGKPLLCVYEKGRPIRCSTPQVEACQKDFYSFVQGGTKNVGVERWFAAVERRVSQVIHRVTASRSEPSVEEKQYLALFLGTMYTRTPLGRKMDDEKFGPATTQLPKEAAANPETFREMYLSTDPEDRTPATIEQVRLQIVRGEGEALEQREDFKLASVIAIGQMVGKVLFGMGWPFLYAHDPHRFLTSDNPLVSETGEPDSRAVHFRMGVDLPGVTVWFPLTQRVIIRIIRMQKGLEPAIGQVIGSGVRMLNKRVMMCADRRIYAAEESPSLQNAFEKHGCQVPLENLDLRYEGRKI